MAALLIALPQKEEPKRLWTNLGPKTVEEVIQLLNNPRFNWSAMSYRDQTVVNLFLDEADAYAEDKARTAAKGLTKAQKIAKWQENKKLAAQRSRR